MKAAHTFLNSDYFKKCDVKWSIFHDDDAFVNYPKFESIIDHDSKPKVGSDLIPDPALYCMWNGIKPQIPMRFSKYKGESSNFLVKNNVVFSVSSSDYPFGYWFPPFCNGPCAGVPVDISKKLLTVAESRKQSSFGLEDVLFTGIYRQIANVTNIRRLPYICEHFR